MHIVFMILEWSVWGFFSKKKCLDLKYESNQVMSFRFQNLLENWENLLSEFSVEMGCIFCLGLG